MSLVVGNISAVRASRIPQRDGLFLPFSGINDAMSQFVGTETTHGTRDRIGHINAVSLLRRGTHGYPCQPCPL